MRKKKYRKNYTEELQYFEKGWKKFWEKTQYTLEDIKSEVEDYGFSLIEKRYDRETNTTEYLMGVEFPGKEKYYIIVLLLAKYGNTVAIYDKNLTYLLKSKIIKLSSSGQKILKQVGMFIKSVSLLKYE